MNLLPSNTHDLVQRTDALIGIGERLLQAYEEPLTEAWWNSLSKEWQEILYAHVRIQEENKRREDENRRRKDGISSGAIRFRVHTSILEIYRRVFNEHIQVQFYEGFLQDLSKLNALHLANNKLNGYSPFKKLKNVTRISLRNNEITDISFLQDLKGLTSLYLGGNQITDISFLQDLKGLTYLRLENNQITDISALQGLKSLTKLDLENNQITDISALQGLKSLTELDLENNQITDISALQGLKSLTELDLENNQITDISLEFLNSLPNLEKLYLGGNPIQNITKTIFGPNMLHEIRADLEGQVM